VFHKPPQRVPTQQSPASAHRLAKLTTALALTLAAPALLAQDFASEVPALETVHWPPRIRSELLANPALPIFKTNLMPTFLVETLGVDTTGLRQAPRIVATQNGHALLGLGERIYAQGPLEAPLLMDPHVTQKIYQIYRDAPPLNDPLTGELLGFPAQYVGKALLVRGESNGEGEGQARTHRTPATLAIVESREEIRPGDRLLTEPAPTWTRYEPRLPPGKVDARIVALYGTGAVNAAHDQLIVINRGRRDGLEVGHILSILKSDVRRSNQSNEALHALQLPQERNGFAMVHRSYDKFSYALILNLSEAAQVGAQLVTPHEDTNN
jgi:hypothetical protein